MKIGVWMISCLHTSITYKILNSDCGLEGMKERLEIVRSDLDDRRVEAVMPYTRPETLCDLTEGQGEGVHPMLDGLGWVLGLRLWWDGAPALARRAIWRIRVNVVGSWSNDAPRRRGSYSNDEI
jgi:hypothetical protein